MSIEHAAPRPPDQIGRGLVNLSAHLEWSLAGSALAPGLAADLADAIPQADAIVLVLFDGLGSHQLDHPSAGALRSAAAGTIDAPFPTTTTVSLATLATGVSPAEHGLIAHALSLPALGTVVNTIHMRTVFGQDLDLDLDGFLPSPTLWTRLAAAGIEPVTVQPGNFGTSALTRTLYGGSRFEGYFNADEITAVTADVASHRGRFVFVYVPFIDLAAHMHGQASAEYAKAVAAADAIWDRLSATLPDTVALVGTSDHGHIDIAADRRIRLTEADESGLLLAGDSRALFVTGDPAPILQRAPAQWVPIEELDGFWGPRPVHERFRDRLPDGVVFPDEGWAVFARYMNDRLIGYHGGLSDEEREIPLLVRR
jgi:hypothetical protein